MTKQQRLYATIAIVAICLIALAVSIVSASAQTGWPNNAFTCETYKADLYWHKWARRHCPEYRQYRIGRSPASNRRHPGASPANPRLDPGVMAAQLRLQQLGYDIEADGLMGPETREALESFQEAQGLAPVGRLGPRTERALWRASRDTEGIHEHEDPEWSRRPEICREDDGRECTCEPITSFSGEHVTKDARAEVKKRWRGEVRSKLGELWLGMEETAKPHCWITGTGERTTDRLNQVRCVIEVKACFGPPAPQEETTQSSYGTREE